MDKYTATEMAFKHGYEKGYEAGKPKWIPVSERFPRDGDAVIAYYQDGKMRITKINGGFPMVLSDKMDWVRVTHWMPLPEQPKEGEL